MVNQLGKKQFTFLKMQEYGFWPKNLPTPYEQQLNESDEEFAERKKLMKNYDKLITQITALYNEKHQIIKKLKDFKKQYSHYDDIDQIRKEIAKEIMKESIKRRAERKKQRELEKRKRADAWRQKKKEEIVFVGNGYSSFLYHYETKDERLQTLNLPLLKHEQDLMEFLELEYRHLRFITYHRDVLSVNHYVSFEIPKKRGGSRTIAAPKPILKRTQKIILEKILSKIDISKRVHGFLRGKSVITGANDHPKQPYLIITMDLKDFFPTITFERVRGMFHSFGYSGHISTLLGMICTYCERIPIEVKGETKYVATSRRILPQGSPASPMITNIICRRLDKRLNGLANTYGFVYTRYADDISFSLEVERNVNFARFCGLIYMIINEEGFQINKNKTRFLRKNNQQKITGIVLNNSEIGLPRKWIRKFRAAIYNANKVLKKENNLPEEKIYEISGMLSWVKSVNPNRYKSLINEATTLINNSMHKK